MTLWNACLAFKLTISGLSPFQFFDDMHRRYLTIVSENSGGLPRNNPVFA